VSLPRTRICTASVYAGTKGGGVHSWLAQAGRRRGAPHSHSALASPGLPPPVLLHSSPRWRSEHTLPTVKLAHHRARTGTLVFVFFFRPVQPVAPCRRSDVICCCCSASPSSTNVSRKSSAWLSEGCFFLVCVTLTHWKVRPGRINFSENCRRKFYYKLSGF
jgi:hypothetical protein